MDMNIKVSPSIFKSRVSLSNIVSKGIPNSVVFTYNPIEVRYPTIVEFLRSSKNNANYLVTGTTFVEGVLKTDDKELVSYSPVYLYSTVTGVLLSKSFTDVNGYYRFDYLRPGFSYMIVSYDRTSVKNATIIEFTLKEENV